MGLHPGGLNHVLATQLFKVRKQVRARDAMVEEGHVVPLRQRMVNEGRGWEILRASKCSYVGAWSVVRISSPIAEHLCLHRIVV